MTPLKCIKVLSRSPLIVIAEAFTRTPPGKMFKPPGGWFEFEGAPHAIEGGISRGNLKGGIEVGHQVILELRPI